MQIINIARKIYLSIDTAIPCGLILNELISNSLKHAFPNKDFLSSDAAIKQDEITIKLYKESAEKISLLYKDNGVGLPEGFDFRNTESLGLQLIVSLVQQIKGTIQKLDMPGTAYQIIFKV